MNIDILAFGAHPDDVECAVAGIVLSATANHEKVVICDLTKGELGSFGDEHSRKNESEIASKMLNLFAREQLDLEDGNIENSHENRLKVIRVIRKYRPKIILANAIRDRHPDHHKAAELVSEASFLAGLKKIVTFDDEGKSQEKWRPEAVYHYIQDLFMEPSVVVDISAYFDQKMEVIKAYNSQFVTANDNKANGIMNLLKQIESTNQIFGRAINVKYAEGLTSERYVGTRNLLDLL